MSEVTSVNGKTGAVVLNAANVEAVAAVTAEYEPTGAGETVFANATAGAFAIPLPAPGTGNKGWRFTVVNTSTNANAVTVEPKAGEILGPEDGVTPTKKLKLGKGQVYYAITVMSDGSNYHVI